MSVFVFEKKKVILTVLSRLHSIKQLKISEITTNYLEINNRLTFSLCASRIVLVTSWHVPLSNLVRIENLN